MREPFASLAEAVLGDDCHVMSQNALAYEPGAGGGWHTDCDAVEFGCTQVVPGSHRRTYRMPDCVWQGAGPRLQRFLGRHAKGAYG